MAEDEVTARRAADAEAADAAGADAVAKCYGACGPGTESAGWSARSAARPGAHAEAEEWWTREVVVGSHGEVKVVEARVQAAAKSGGRRRSMENWVKIEDRVFPYTAVGRLVLVFGDRTFFCSATMVAENVLLTAAHCVVDSQGELTNDIVFYPNLQSDERIAETARVIGAYGFLAKDESYLFHPDRDWAFLFLRESLGNKYGWLQTALPSRPAMQSAEGLAVRVGGYARHAACDEGKALCVGRGPMTGTENDNEGMYMIDTAGGSSGGPVYTVDPSDRTHRVVGVHVRASESGLKFAVLGTAFQDHVGEAKRRAFVSSGPSENVIKGVVCLAHEHCDETSFCSNRLGRCFRCEACPREPGLLTNEIDTFNLGACPAKCGSEPASEAARLALDLDFNSCVVSRSADAVTRPLCALGLCIDRTLCGVRDSLTAAELPEFISFGGAFVPHRFADELVVPSVVLDSFNNDANALAWARGYSAGALRSDGVIVAFGGVRTLGNEGDTGSEVPEPGGTGDAEETSEGGKVAGIVLLALAFVGFSAGLVFKAVRTKQRARDKREAAQNAGRELAVAGP